MGGGGSGTPNFGKQGGGTPTGAPRGSGTGSGGDDPCDGLEEFTDLLSPKPDLVKDLRRKQVLDLVLRKGEPPILVCTREAKPIPVGSVVPLMLEMLLECMATGKEFEAEVVSVVGGNCKLAIRRKKD
jgi:hypothetical protein